MTQTAFTRTEMLPPIAPPISERGVVKWLRENLFSSIPNIILTLAALFAVYWLVSLSLPWFLNGVWHAETVQQCRQIIAETAGPDASGACWAVIRVRWNQFLFGLYPVEEYWRPTLAFALMFVAIAPVLYSGLRKPCTIIVGIAAVLLSLALYGLGTDGWHGFVAVLCLAALTAVAWIAPKKLVWVTLVFPLLAFFLLWGGSVWGPVSVAIAFGILGLAFVKLASARGLLVASLAVALLFLCCFVNPIRLGESFLSNLVYLASFGTYDYVLHFDLRIGGYDLTELFPLHSALSGYLDAKLPIGLLYVRSDDFGGFLLAFVIGITAITASLPIGILLALGRQSDMPLVKSISVGFIEFFRGVPLITVLFSANFMLLYFLPPQTNFDLIVRVIIVVVIFASAYIAEVIRGGLAALPRGQYEAADALGLDYWQAQRLIIMPQALKISIPGIVSSFIGLFKDTTLVALVGLADPLTGVRKFVLADSAWKGIYWEPFIFVGAIFFVVCFSMSRYSMYLEQKLKTDHV